ncbi:unnamed protein product, partial [Rotaria sp. Silwood1]
PKCHCHHHSYLHLPILCNARQELCRVGRVFDAQIGILNYTSIIRQGHPAVLHIHTAVAGVQLKRLITLINHETGAITKQHPIFIKQGQVATATLKLSQPEQIICMELFESFPQLGRFTLSSGGRTIAVGKVIKIIE